MKVKGKDDKTIKIGDIAVYRVGERDERPIRVDYASECTVSGTIFKKNSPIVV